MVNPSLVSLGAGQSLSFAYLRDMDSTERTILEAIADEEVMDARADGRELGWAMAQAVATLLIFGPLLYIMVLALEAAGLRGINQPVLWQVLLAGWFGFFAMSGAWRIYRRRKSATAARALVFADLQAGHVREEAWRFVETIAFQEAEKMPFLYAMHADNGMVVVLDEVVLRGTDKGTGIASASVAPADAVMVRAPQSGRLVSASYSGPTLPVLEVYPLPLPPEARPPHGALLDATWEEVPQLFGGTAGRLL